MITANKLIIINAFACGIFSLPLEKRSATDQYSQRMDKKPKLQGITSALIASKIHDFGSELTGALSQYQINSPGEPIGKFFSFLISKGASPEQFLGLYNLINRITDRHIQDNLDIILLLNRAFGSGLNQHFCNFTRDMYSKGLSIKVIGYRELVCEINGQKHQLNTLITKALIEIAIDKTGRSFDECVASLKRIADRLSSLKISESQHQHCCMYFGIIFAEEFAVMSQFPLIGLLSFEIRRMAYCLLVPQRNQDFNLFIKRCLAEEFGELDASSMQEVTIFDLSELSGTLSQLGVECPLEMQHNPQVSLLKGISSLEGTGAEMLPRESAKTLQDVATSFTQELSKIVDIKNKFASYPINIDKSIGTFFFSLMKMRIPSEQIRGLYNFCNKMTNRHIQDLEQIKAFLSKIPNYPIDLNGFMIDLLREGLEISINDNGKLLWSVDGVRNPMHELILSALFQAAGRGQSAAEEMQDFIDSFNDIKCELIRRAIDVEDELYFKLVFVEEAMQEIKNAYQVSLDNVEIQNGIKRSIFSSIREQTKQDFNLFAKRCLEDECPGLDTSSMQQVTIFDLSELSEILKLVGLKCPLEVEHNPQALFLSQYHA